MLTMLVSFCLIVIMSVSGQLPPRKIDPRLGLGFGLGLPLKLGLGLEGNFLRGQLC